MCGLVSRNTEQGCSANPHAGSVRYPCSAGILPAGSGGIRAARWEWVQLRLGMWYNSKLELQSAREAGAIL